MSFFGIILLVCIEIVLVVFAFILVGFIVLYGSMFFGAPYVPSSEEKIRIAKKFMVGRHRVLELGSGDGRVSIELAEQNDRVDGYEINFYFVWLSNWKAYRKGLSDRVRFYWKNIWRANVSEYDAIYLYMLPFSMKLLEKKLLKELRPGAIVVSVGFYFPNWVPEKSEGRVWRYVKA